ncbi:MAG: Methyltransferase type 11, partial [Chitinophagaceae bacterium]|nr:Methyltransferase type 11 [Chitinophagaceae bacterium]
MKEFLKKILKAANLYHPLQLFYRQLMFSSKKRYLRFRYRKFKKKIFTCNVCGNYYSKFAPAYPSAINRAAIQNHAVIAGYGENIICPNCLSVARDRLVLAMLEKVDLQQKKVLHLSPEKNIYTFLSAKASVETADLMPGFYKNIDPNIREADATKLPYAGNYFDLVIGNHILEHIPDDRLAMKEIFRVLRSPGMAILQVPFSTEL